MAEDIGKKEEYSYDSYGIFWGLISYPFDKDGKKIYKDLEAFFKEHKQRLRKYDPSEESDLTEFNKYLYKPAGYRMFGSQGLAVLSLVDDYTFPIRYFDKDHIQTLFEANSEAKKKRVDGTDKTGEMYFKDFHSVAVMGVTEKREGEASIINKARVSFLKKKARFPFIGIIRLKIKSENFLLGNDKGIKTVRLIREQIDKLSKDSGITEKTPDAQSFHITMECYDNDEMTVVAFSDSLLYLFNFLGEIRSMTNKHIGMQILEENGNGEKKNVESHVFGSTLISFGYDVNQKDNDDFRQKLKGFNMKCLIETKSGHRDSLFDFLNDQQDNDVKELGISSVVKNMTGGCNIIATMPLAKVFTLEKICLNNATIKRDVKKMKVVLEDCTEGRITSKVDKNHGGTEPEKGIKTAKDMKELMKKVGISKPLRDSMLSLYELFSTANEDILQRTYLEELRDTLEHFYEELQQKYEGGYPISEIEESLDVEIRNMENAIYDRLHLQKRVQAPLEYSCGIQQYLTSFNYAYSKTSRFFNSHEVYVTITGAERGSSVANSFNLNINEILYPELFFTLLWKEIGNFSILISGEPISEKEHDKETQRCLEIINSWRNLTENEKSYDILLNDILQSPALLDNSLTSMIVTNLLRRRVGTDPELLLYFFKDNLVCHSLFDGDFKMMWHFYLKTLLQTSVCYEKLNQMKREHFIHMLLRLFIVAKLNKEETFVREQMEKPFDSLIGSLWFEHYGKTWEIAEVIYEVLEKFDFYEVSRLLAVYAKISMLFDNNQDNEDDWGEMIRARVSFADKIQSQFEGGQLIEEGREKFDFIISLFLAYMKVIYSMDNNGNCLIKSLPRDEKGCVDEFLVKGEKNKYFDNAIALIADPTGGVFVPLAAHRKKYFLYRTVLYRSLWNVRYTDPVKIEKEDIK